MSWAVGQKSAKKRNFVPIFGSFWPKLAHISTELACYTDIQMRTVEPPSGSGFTFCTHVFTRVLNVFFLNTSAPEQSKGADKQKKGG